MKDNILISVEGKIDKTIVVEIIERIDSDLIKSGYYGKSYKKKSLIIKQNSISKVIDSILKFDGDCIGIIDGDKEKPKQIELFKSCNNSNLSKKLDLSHLEIIHKIDGAKTKYIIILKPAHEIWLEKSLEIIGKSRTNYRFPKDLKQFKKLTGKMDDKTEKSIILIIKDLITFKSHLMLNYKKIFHKILNYHIKFL